jgi:hypothetical protein
MTKTANSKLEDADRTKGSTPSTGAPTSGNDTTKQTPLHLAVRNGKEGVVKALLKKGTDKHAEDKDGKTALVKGHASTETLDENQDTLLHQAVREGQEAAVTIPLDLHAKIEAKDSNGKTPLENSIKNGQKSITKILVDKNANTELVQLDGTKEAQDTSSEGRMPLRKAVSNGHANMEARTILNYPLPVLNYPLPNEYYYDIPIRSSYPMALQRSNGSTDSTWSNTTPIESYQSRHSYQPYGRAGYTASTQATSQYPSYDSTSRSQSNG